MKINFYTMLEHMNGKINKDFRFFDVDSSFLFNKARNYMDENPEKSDEEVDIYLKDFLWNLTQEITELDIFKDDAIRSIMISYLCNNPEKLKENYEKYKDYDELINKVGKEYPIEYDSNEQESIKKTIMENLHIVRLIENEMTDSAYESYKQLSTDEKAKKFDIPNYKLTYECYDILKTKGEFEAFKYVCESKKTILEQEMKKKGANNLSYILNKLDEFKCLDFYIDSHNRKCEFLNLQPLKYTKDDLMNEDTIKNLSIEQSNVLFSFWINRYIKEVELLNNAYFSIKTLNLLPIIRNAIKDKNGNVMIEIDKNTKYGLCEKNAILTNTVKRIYSNADFEERQKGEERKIGEFANGYFLFDITKELNEIDEKIGFDYYDYFAKKGMNGDNDIKEDIKLAHEAQQTVSLLYKLKDSQISILLDMLYHSNDVSDNWGLILNGNELKNKDLIGIDIEGLNMPLRLHNIKRDLLDFFRAKGEGSICRVYDGGRDFNSNVGGNFLTTIVLFPFTEEQREFIKNTSNFNSPEYPYLFEHLKYLEDKNEYPGHLKIKKVTEKYVVKDKTRARKKYIKVTEVEKLRPNTKFVDINTKEFYQKVDNNYVKIEEKEKDDDGR